MSQLKIRWNGRNQLVQSQASITQFIKIILYFYKFKYDLNLIGIKKIS